MIYCFLSEKSIADWSLCIFYFCSSACSLEENTYMDLKLGERLRGPSGFQRVISDLMLRLVHTTCDIHFLTSNLIINSDFELQDISLKTKNLPFIPPIIGRHASLNIYSSQTIYLRDI